MEDSNSSTGESEALSVLEQETLRLLRSADARAADALAALNDASRAKVLNALATEQAGGESDEPSARSSVPVGALDLRADAETSSVERSQRRVWRWVAAGALVVAGAAVAAVLLLGGEGGEDPRSPAGETKADFNNKVMMSRERNGDLYLVEPGEDVRRSALAVRDIGGTAAFGDIGRICGGRLCESLVASAGAYTFFVASDSSGDVLWAAQEDVDENEDTQFEEFMSADRITIRIVDDGVRIREERGDSQRCYVGSLDKLERVFRGDFCQVSFSDRVLGADLVDGEYETTVLSTESVLSAESETATELMVGQLEGFPQLGSYGRILISDDGESTRLISVDSGDDVWDSGDRVIRRVSSRPSGVALAVEGSTGGLELVYINESWQVETATELERGDLSFAFSETGDLFWTERPEGDTVQLFVWDDELVSGVELLSETGMAIRDVYRESVIVSVVDDFGMRLLRIAPNGESRELHELESETLREVGGRSASSVGEVVVDGEYLYASNGEKTSVVPLAGGTPVDSETWDAVRIVDTFGGMLVGLGIDDDQQVLFGIRDGLDEIIEYGDLDAAGFAQAFGEWLYVEDQEDVLVFGLETGDEIRDLSYEGYDLIPTRAKALEDVRSLRVSPLAAAPPADDDAAAPPPMEPAPARPLPEDLAPEDLADVGFDDQEFDSIFGVNCDAYHDVDLEDVLFSPGDDMHYRWSREIFPEYEVDSYIFELSAIDESRGAVVVIETFGETDTYLRLLRLVSASESELLEVDDDSGISTNARIEAELSSGCYVVEVSGYSGATGSYDLEIVKNRRDG